MSDEVQTPKNSTVPLEETLHDVFDIIENHGQRGIETGFFELDDILNGLQFHEMIVIGSRPSVGKTSFALNIMEHVACDTRLPSALFTYEMTSQQVVQRMICSRGQIDAHRLRKGLLPTPYYGHLLNVVGEMAKAPIWTISVSGMDVDTLIDLMRLEKEAHDTKLFIIDYLQLIEAPGQNDCERLSYVTRKLKAFVLSCRAALVCLSELNRPSDAGYGYRPRLTDLRGSGTIEDEADVVLLLYREDMYRMSEPDFQPDNIADVIVAKQRNGPTGTVKLTFLNKTTRFENLSTQNDPFA